MAPSGKVRRKSGGEGRKWPAGTKIKRGRQVSDEKTACGRNRAPKPGAGEFSLIQRRRRRKGEGRRQSRGNPERNNVARIKDGDGRTDGNADVYPRTVGRGRRPQSRRAAGNGAGQRHAGGEAKIKPRRAVSFEEFRACRGILHGPNFGKKI